MCRRGKLLGCFGEAVLVGERNSKIETSLRIVRTQANRTRKFLNGLGRPSHHPVHLAEIVMAVGIVGITPNRLDQLRQCLL